LFSAIGTVYGTGDGSTTFNQPDLRGRVPVGRNGGSFGTLGATGGVESVTLTSGQIPGHTHTFSATSSTDGAHTHNVQGNGLNMQLVDSNTADGSANRYRIAAGFPQLTATSAGAHSHTVSGTTGSTGSGESHTNVQPYQVVNYIIKATAASTAGDSELATRVQPVTLGGTGTTSLTVGNYLKGNGTDAIVTQTGVPATDLTGTINTARLPNIPIDIGGTGATTGSALVPIVPSSVSVSTGSATVNSNGMVTVTNANNVQLRNVFSSQFINYRIVYRGVLNSNSGFTIYFVTGTTANTTGNYAQNNAWWGSRGNNSTSSTNATQFGGFFGHNRQGWSGDIFSPNLAQRTHIYGIGHASADSDGAGEMHVDGCTFKADTVFDGIQLSANLYQSATFQVYGYRNQ